MKREPYFYDSRSLDGGGALLLDHLGPAGATMATALQWKPASASWRTTAQAKGGPLEVQGGGGAKEAMVQ